MKVSRIALFAVAASLLIASTSCKSSREKYDSNAVQLFDGSSVEGWRQAGPGEFMLDRGELVATGGMGLYWYAERSFRDFSLHLQWKVEDVDDNSGVFVRFPDPGDDPWIAVNEGYEIQICDSAAPKHNTGSVYSFQAPSHVPTKPAGEWNDYEIMVVGQEYTISVNGEVVAKYTGDRSREGYVGLQNHDDGSPVRYRDIRVTEL